MKVLTDEESTWISEVANRLRLIHADAATAAPEKRREYIQEEAARSLKSVPPANRKRFIEALLARFPVAGEIARPAPEAPPIPVAPPPVDETPEIMVDRLLAVAAKLPEDKRSELAKRLAGAGLAWVDRDALIMEISDELRQRRELQPDQQPRLKRLVELTVILIDLLGRLDQAALNTLRELSPKSPLLKRQQEFRSSAARFLASENEPVEPHLQLTRGLLGALLAAIQVGGKEFGRQYVEKFSPTAIEDVVIEGKMFGPTKKERCWDKYVQLANDYATPDMIDRKIKDCLVRFVENLMR